MEEKLAMLEQSGGEMAEELVSKTKLIQQYCMDTGAKRGPNRWTTYLSLSSQFISYNILS